MVVIRGNSVVMLEVRCDVAMRRVMEANMAYRLSREWETIAEGSEKEPKCLRGENIESAYKNFGTIFAMGYHAMGECAHHTEWLSPHCSFWWTAIKKSICTRRMLP